MNHKRHHRGRRKKKKGSLASGLIFVIAVFVFCVSAFQLFKIMKGYYDGRSEYDKIRKLAVTESDNGDSEDDFRVDFE